MMEPGKFYTLDPAAKKQFIAGSPDDNSRMVKLMAMLLMLIHKPFMCR